MRISTCVTLLISSLIVCGCSSIKGNGAYVSIEEHFSVDPGYAAAESKATKYCAQYGQPATFQKKREGCLFGCETENTAYEFKCGVPVVPEAKPQTTYQAPKPNTTGIEEAKTKCAELGKKPGTEGFGKCVLQLSK